MLKFDLFSENVGVHKDKWLFLSKETEESDDWLLSSLSAAESDVKELIDYIGDLINKKQKFKEMQL